MIKGAIQSLECYITSYNTTNVETQTDYGTLDTHKNWNFYPENTNTQNKRIPNYLNDNDDMKPFHTKNPYFKLTYCHGSHRIPQPLCYH